MENILKKKIVNTAIVGQLKVSLRPRVRPLSPLVVHSRGEEKEGSGEESQEDSLDYSTEGTPAMVWRRVFDQLGKFLISGCGAPGEDKGAKVPKNERDHADHP